MKLFLQILIPIFFFASAFAQEIPNVEVKAVEYVWERKAGDNRIVVAKDIVYQEILEKSFTKAAEDRWHTTVPAFDVKVDKLSAFRVQPKFNTSISNADTSKQYVFLQLFDKSLPVNRRDMLFSARIEARYKLIKGGIALEDRTTSFKILTRNPSPGQIVIERYPFHPSQFKYLCDTIASKMLNQEINNEREIWLEPACTFTNETIKPNFSTHNFNFGATRQTISVYGGNGFNIKLDSIIHIQTGKKKHGVGNTVGGLLTFFSNIDTEKKRSTLHTAHHSFSEGSTKYRAYVSYVSSKVAERRRVQDEDGYKNVEVGEYVHNSTEIQPNAKHLITVDGDTASSFNIKFYRNDERFLKMWDGRDSTTIDSLPLAFNNIARVEMELRGNIDGDRFELKTADEGKIKTLTLNDEEVFSYYCNYGPVGLLSHRNLNERQLKIITLLCLLSEPYYQYQYIML
jgi:hypothetical protein